MSMEYADDFGNYLRAARHAADFSQRDLATNAGVAASTLARIEAGASQPRLGLAMRLLAATGHQLVVVHETTGGRLMPIETDHLFDAAGRRYPAHCDVRPVGSRYRDWWGDLGYTGRRRPTHTFDLSRDQRDWRRQHKPETLCRPAEDAARVTE
jgi:transcriptional regulator with XRE-family HTH domain